MASPRFVVKRIGNDYKILPADAQGVALSALPLAGGGLLALKGLFRGGLLGQLMFLTGSGTHSFLLKLVSGKRWSRSEK